MLGVAFVPEGDIVDAPAPAQDELGLPGVREQELEQALALARLDAVDVRREALVDEQALAMADRVSADHGMIDGRVLGDGPFVAFLECGITLPALGRKGLRHRMPRRQAVKEPA